MKLSTTTSVIFHTFGYEEGIEKLAEIGFDALDMSLYAEIYKERFEENVLEKTCETLAQTAKNCGIYFNQAHAPFPSYKFLKDEKEREEYNAKIEKKLHASIKAAGILGAEQIVVHPIDVPDKKIQKEFNIEFYNKLVPLCKEYNIKISLENMWGHSQVDGSRIVPNVCSYARDLADYYEALDPKYFNVCLDLGHCGLVGEAAENAIRELGHDRLHALHVHDNDHKNDLHTFPYFGKMNWQEITKALADIDYTGDFTYEVCGSCLAPYKGDCELLVKALEFLHATGRKLISMIEEAK